MKDIFLRLTRVKNLYFLLFITLYLISEALQFFYKSHFIKNSQIIFTLIFFSLGCLYIIVKIKMLDQKILLLFLVMYCFLSLNLVINFQEMSLNLFLKIIAIPIVFLWAYSVNFHCETFYKTNITRYEQILVLLLYLIVFLSLIHIQIFKNLEIDQNNSIFANKNNAAFYVMVIASFFYFYSRKIKIYLILLFIPLIMIKTLGAFLAALFAFLLILLRDKEHRKKIFYISIFVYLTVYFIFFFDLERYFIFERVRNFVELIKFFYQNHSLTHIADISYQEVVNETGITDLSFLFRIKHWINIWHIYCSSDILNLLFGCGLDSMTNLSNEAMRPHNDYLRVLVEIGPFFFFVFLMFHLIIVKKIGLTFFNIPFISCMLYYFSENLLDNFVVICMFYYLMGCIYAQEKIKNILGMNI